MRVQATLDREGHIRLPLALRLRRDPTPVWVEIPDQALQPEPESEPSASLHGEDSLSKGAQALLAACDAIRTQPLTEQERPRWTEARQSRERAFQLREELRRERTLGDG